MTLTREQIWATLGSSDEPAAGYYRLRLFCEQVENNKAPDQQILDDLAAAFRKMLDEESLKKRPAIFTDEMNLQGKGGRSSKEEEYWAYAVGVFLLMEKGDNKTKAVEKIAKDAFKDESIIWAALKKHEASAKSTAKYFLKVERDIAYVKSLTNK